MIFSLRRVSVLCTTLVFMLLAASCGEQSITGVPLAPGTVSHSSSEPYLCTSAATCVGTPSSGVVTLEVLEVCKVYPAGTVNPPNVQVQLAVRTNNVSPSPTALTFTIRPNTCEWIWSNGATLTSDVVTVTELTPPGYTTTTQVTSIVHVTSPNVRDVTTTNPPTTSATATGLIGGPGIPGMTVTFVNTPIPMVPQASIGDFVWNDLNANGVQDTGEPGIPGVSVMLSNGMTTTTDANGAYSFTGLPAGIYTVTVATPTGFAPSPLNVGSPSTDSNGSGTSVSLTTSPDNTIDFGFYKLVSIGDYVWNDLNANGVQEAGEPGIAGVLVTLSNGATATTDALGAYSFPNLAPGTYTVTVATPAGYVASPTGAGSLGTDSNGSGTSVTVAGNSDNTIDFGFFSHGSIGDFVWNDVNANGIQDSGEPGIAGVTVTLSNGATTITSASGAYLFSNLAPGTYTVTVATPAGYVASPPGAGTPGTDSNGSGTSVAIAGNSDDTIDFGFYKLGSIGDFVWNDLNADGVQGSSEPGLAGVVVTLTGGVLPLTTTTNAAGGYSFGNLQPGTYTVSVAAPAAYVASPQNAGTPTTDSNNGAGTTVVIAGNDDNTIDFGFFSHGSIGNFVWNDVNANGIQDSGEPGIAGVTVTLSNGATTTTSASGAYLFSNLAPGTYTVTVATPAGYVASPTGAGTPGTDSNGSGTSVAIAGNLDDTIDFGFYKLGSIGDFVWNDLNADGVQGSSEPGLAGVVVTLTGGVLPLTTTTNAAGGYSFGNLQPGTYTVSVAAPAAYVASPQNAGTPTTDSNNGAGTTVVIAGNDDNTIDFGFFSHGSIGNFVWNDVNANGIQDSGEPGIAGVTVTLSNGATTTTNAAGAYSFTNLAPGTYTVTVATPAGYVASPTGAGTPGTDSNGSGTSVAIAGNTDDTIDFGFYKLGAIGNFVWNDVNANGIQDAGEAGIAGVTVKLNTGATTTTSASGAYSFTNLVPGTYTVTVVLPTGYVASPSNVGTDRTIDSNGSGSTVVIAGNTDNTIDFGLHTTATGFTTYTQGGWGAVPRGGNPAQILVSNWTTVYGAAGVTIGGTRTLKFTSALGVQNFLPQGGTPAVLGASATNPTTSAAGVFAGQVLALQLSVDFSNKGITKAGMGSLHLTQGKLAGQTISQVLALANSVLGGGALPAGLTISDLNNIVDALNNNYDNGTTNNGYVN